MIFQFCDKKPNIFFLINQIKKTIQSNAKFSNPRFPQQQQQLQLHITTTTTTTNNNNKLNKQNTNESEK